VRCPQMIFVAKLAYNFTKCCKFVGTMLLHPIIFNIRNVVYDGKADSG